jgi:hypothetical protein
MHWARPRSPRSAPRRGSRRGACIPGAGGGWASGRWSVCDLLL